MTEKLFNADPYMKETSAVVTKIEGNKVYLDRTIFFAFSGGQASDSGTINNQPASNIEKEGDEIVHTLENPGFSIGDTVNLKIDWDRRYKIMKLHSAAHIVYYFLREKIGKFKMIGSNISSDKARIDFEYQESIKPVLADLEAQTNKKVDEGLEIKTYDDEKEKGKRWWAVGDWKMPCGGTHPKNTKEIGHIKLKRVNIGAGKERIEVLLS